MESNPPSQGIFTRWSGMHLPTLIFRIPSTGVKSIISHHSEQEQCMEMTWTAGSLQEIKSSPLKANPYLPIRHLEIGDWIRYCPEHSSSSAQVFKTRPVHSTST